MERLSRTQKYSDLRKQLENNNEVEGKTEDLSTFEEKLKNVEETLQKETMPKVEEIIPVVEEVTPVEMVEEVVAEPVQETVVEPVVEVTPVVEETVEETPVVEEVPAPTPVEEVKEDDLVDLLSLIEEPKEEAVVEEVVQTIEETPVESVVEETPVVEEIVTETPVTEEVHVEPVVEEPVMGDDYLKQCLEEVNEYNKSKGLMTAEDVPATILDEIRGTAVETATEETPVEEVKEEDFNNTVTLEIKKILDSMAEEEEETPVEEVSLDHLMGIEEEPVKEEDDLEKLFQTAGISKEAAELLRPYLKASETQEEVVKEEHPVLTQAVEETEVEAIEISETASVAEEIEKTKEDLLVADVEMTGEEPLLNDTIPFVVESEKQEISEDVEDEDDSTPNKILNIILIVLIVVLVAVLGVIVYWILLAQGIL